MRLSPAAHKLALQFGSYLIFGGIATVVDVGALYLLTEWGRIFYLVSTVIAYCLGMLTNYTLNKRFTFRNESRRVAVQFSVFAAVALVGLGINVAIVYASVQFFHLYYLFGKLIAVGVSVIWSFFGHKRFTFRLLQ